MALKALIKVYLTIGVYADCGLYRRIGIAAIDVYQSSIRKFYSRECQFKVSCSHFLKEQLCKNKSFKDLSLNMTMRIIDCSEPLDMSYSSTSGISATGPSGRRYSRDELSDGFVGRIEKRVTYARN